MNEGESSTSTPSGAAAAGGRPIGSAHHFVLACIGLLSWLADELPMLLEQSVPRSSRFGDRVPVEAKHHAAVTEAEPQVVAERQPDLTRQGLPSHQDFEALLQQLNELERQIDRLAAQRATRS